jgi:hypothetical protein
MNKTRQSELKALVSAMGKSYESERHSTPHRNRHPARPR